MYTELVAMASVTLLVIAISRKQTQGFWVYIIMLSSAVLGSSVLAEQLVIPMLNGASNWLADMVFGGNTTVSQWVVEGGASGATLGIAIPFVAFIWKDKHIRGWELPVLIVLCAAIGSTPLVTTWLPMALGFL